MALLNKLNRMARTLGEFASEALEAGRESREREAHEANGGADRIGAERAAAHEQFRIIGEYYYNVYLRGGGIAEEVAGACEIAKKHMDAIAAEEERLRRESELAAQEEQAGQYEDEDFRSIHGFIVLTWSSPVQFFVVFVRCMFFAGMMLT